MKSTNQTKSSKKRFFSLFFIIAAFVLTTGTIWLNHSSAAGNNFFGAIYTSSFDGTTVNQNLYDNKADVYLNGGPQNLNGNGIPNGTYYYQVTDPSGATLLSSDPARCRQLSVANGVVSGAAGPCQHANGTLNPNNGSTSVQLIPFADTPNNGGEYKVHLIRQTSQTTIVGDPMTSLILDFRPADSKTDNFKVRRTNATPTPTPPMNVTYTLRGCKFYDRNANGLWEMGGLSPEVTVTGVRIVVTLNGVEQPAVTTGANGCWELTGVPLGAEYSVVEIIPETGMNPAFYWRQTAPGVDGDLFRGYSGVADGAFVCDMDDVCVGEIGGLNFGDICFGPAAGGKTLGYWSNKNGQATMTNGTISMGANMIDVTAYPVINPGPDFGGLNGDLAFLNRLNLKNATGSDLVLGTGTPGYNSFRTWLLNGNAVNMAYMLSVQLSASSLDVRHKFFSDSQIVDASSLGLGFTSIGSVRLAANTELNLAGGNVTFTGNPLRDDEEILKDFLDGVNNNRLPFAQANPCPVVYPTPTPTPTPAPTP